MATCLGQIGQWAAPAGEEEDLSMPVTESQNAFDLLDERR
jgi:RND superfamily putative drug exporter